MTFSNRLFFFIFFLIWSSVSADIKIEAGKEPMITLSSSSLESLIDTRFNILSSGFKRQFEDLNTKVDKLVANKTEDIGTSHNPFTNKEKPEVNKASSKSPKFCENSSSFCNFYYPDHPDSASKKGQHSPTVSNEMLTNPSKVKGMPKNCVDLQLLGHKLNGLYLVKTSRPNQGTKIDTVFCDFQSPTAVVEKGGETRIGSVDVKSSSVQFHVERLGVNWGTKGAKITFYNQVLNVGNAFNWTNQWFNAPYPGTYFFAISGTKNAYNETRAGIQVQLNGEPIGEAISSSNTLFGGFSYQFTKKLNATDKLELMMKYGKFYSLYFTGWMLDEDLFI